MVRLAVAAALTCCVPSCTGTQRSDEWMRGHLLRHQRGFEHLVRMATEDYARTKVTRIAPTFTRLEDNWAWPRPGNEWGITWERWEEYRALFEELGLPAGLVVVPYPRLELVPSGEEDVGRRRVRMVEFIVRGVGMAGEGREYGFLWSPEPPTQVRQRGRYEFTTVPYGGSWYRYDSAVY
jgi:hypothetical protein